MARVPPRITPALRALLIAQRNVVALWQLPPGLKRAALRAAALGDWRRLTTRVYLAEPGQPALDQQRWAALLHGGELARLSGRAALTLHGWTLDAPPPHDVVVPHHVQLTKEPAWMRLHRISHPFNGPAARPARTTAHLATSHAAAWARTDREAMLIVLSVLQQRLTSPVRLIDVVAALPKLPRRRLILSVTDDFRGGAQSLNELDFAALCRRHGVPEPVRQRRVYDAAGKLRSIDVEFRARSGRTLRVEIEGLHHLEPANYFADITRHNSLALADPATTLRVTTWHLTHEAAAFFAGLRQAIAQW
jgi:hypothetical protein